MIIPIPCKLGEKALCNGRMLVFCGVDWFRWSSGMEYTYFFETGDSWHEADFYTGDGAGMSKYIEMDNVLLSSFVLREKGFPFRGEGYVEGFRFKNGKHMPISCAKLSTFRIIVSNLMRKDTVFPVGILFSRETGTKNR